MKTTLWLILSVGLGVAGCGRHEESAPAPAPAPSTNLPPLPGPPPVPPPNPPALPGNPPAATTNKPAAGGNPLTAPVDYLGAVAKAKRVAEKTVDLASLNRSIQLFQAQEDRLPKDLNELVALRYLPALPAPPAGMKLVYNAASGEVKMARQ